MTFKELQNHVRENLARLHRPGTTSPIHFEKAVIDLLNDISQLGVARDSEGNSLMPIVESAVDLGISIRNNQLEHTTQDRDWKSCTESTGKRFRSAVYKDEHGNVIRIIVESRQEGLKFVIEGKRPLQKLDQLRGFLKTLSRDIHLESEELLND